MAWEALRVADSGTEPIHDISFTDADRVKKQIIEPGLSHFVVACKCYDISMSREIKIQNTSVLPFQELSVLEPERFENKSGSVCFELIRPGIVVFHLEKVMDFELSREFVLMLEKVYKILESSESKAFLLMDASGLERLSFHAQHLILTRKSYFRSQVQGFYCIIRQPFFRALARLMQRLQPQNVIRVYASVDAALAEIGNTQQPFEPGKLSKGPELSEENYVSGHGSLTYFQPSPEILLCESQGVTNSSVAHHMIDVHSRWLPRLRKQYGRSILIIDTRFSRHSTIEAYRILGGELGDARPQANDIVCVITRHWPKAVGKLIYQMMRNLDFSLLVVGSLEEAFAEVASLKLQPARTSRPRQRKTSIRQKLKQLERENTQLKQERELFFQGAGNLVSDILLHKQGNELYQLNEADLQGPYQEIYEALYMLQNDYQEYLCTLQQEIDERIQAEHRAAELSQIKSRFLGSVSHELRTPLNAIIGFSKILLKQNAGPLTGQQQLFVERVHDNSMHLLTLINDVLDISKIESGTLKLHLEEISMPDFLERVLEPLVLVADRKALPLRLEIDPEAPPVLCSDPDRLRQIVTNLVNNAVKFTGSGHVTLRYRNWPATSYVAALEVEDTGIGIAREDQKKVFDAFIQTHNGNFPGAGLGLSICLSLVYLLGYQIELESEPGKGSLFRVLICLRPGEIMPVAE